MTQPILNRIHGVKFCWGIALCALLWAQSAWAISNEQIEQELVQHYDNIQKFSNYDKYPEGTELDDENRLFLQKILTYAQQASTLSYSFPTLQNNISIATSPDGKLRAYSWDTELGGSMHDFDAVFQYEGQDGQIHVEKRKSYDGGGAFVSDIFQMNIANHPVYMMRSTAILSTSLMYESVDLFSIDGNQLNDNIKLIKTKSGLTQRLGFEYDFFSVVDRPERPIRLIQVNPKQKTIQIPVVMEDKEFRNGGRVTNRFITYKFNGQYFVKQ